MNDDLIQFEKDLRAIPNITGDAIEEIMYIVTHPDDDLYWSLVDIDDIIGGHGPEEIFEQGKLLHYINMGDTYKTTICYEPAKDKWFVGSWGDWRVENINE